MEHNFNLSIAKKFGVEEAIIIHNIYFWTLKNKANGKHFHDGNYWTYNSIEAFTELFPYWSRRQIERILKNAVDKGAIIKGNYNKIAYDRTTWYALTETVKSIYANGEMETTEWGNGSTQSGETIPDSKTDSKPFDKPIEEEEISDFIEFDGLKYPKSHIEHSSTFMSNEVSLQTFMQQNKIKSDDVGSVKSLLMEFNKHLNVSGEHHKELKFKDYRQHFINWHRRMSSEDRSSLKSNKKGQKLPDGVQPAEWLS